MLNRSQALVLAFFCVAWVSFLAILIEAPAVYDQALKLPAGDHHPVELAFLLALSAFLVLLSIGTLRRWRWTFWLVVVAFTLGVLRVPASALELVGFVAATGPTWYVLFQGIVGLIQFAIGLALLAGHRRAGVWGAF